MSDSKTVPTEEVEEVKIRSISSIEVLEGTTGGFYTPYLTADLARHSKTVFTIHGKDSKFFNVHPETGALSFITPPVLESPATNKEYTLELRAGSENDQFAVTSKDLNIRVVEKSVAIVEDFQVLFPPDKSTIAKGIDTQVEIIARVKLSSGNQANIKSVTANGIPLARHSLESGLWHGHAPIAPGTQSVEYEVITSTNEVSAFNSTVSNTAIPFEKTSVVRNTERAYILDGVKGAILHHDFSTAITSPVANDEIGQGGSLRFAEHMDIHRDSGTLFVNGENEMGHATIIAIDTATGNRNVAYTLPEDHRLGVILAIIINSESNVMYLAAHDSTSQDVNKLIELDIRNLDHGIVELVELNTTICHPDWRNTIYCPEHKEYISTLTQTAKSPPETATTAYSHWVGHEDFQAFRAFLNPQYYQATDIDYDQGILAMVSNAQVYLWDPTKLSSQNSWEFKEPWMQVVDGPSVVKYRYLGGIELDVKNNRYFTHYIEKVTYDIGFEATLNFVEVDLDLQEMQLIHSERVTRFYVTGWNGVIIAAPSTFRVNRSEEELKLSAASSYYTNPENIDKDDSEREYHEDASVSGGISLYIDLATQDLVETLPGTSLLRVVSENLGPGQIALTHAPENHLAYALRYDSVRYGNEQPSTLYAISLLSGQKAIMAGQTPNKPEL